MSKVFRFILLHALDLLLLSYFYLGFFFFFQQFILFNFQTPRDSHHIRKQKTISLVLGFCKLFQ
jgi:hypothetical protein